jgi:hypothetical protein
MSHRGWQFVAPFTCHSMICDRGTHDSKPRYRFLELDPNLSAIGGTDGDLVICVQEKTEERKRPRFRNLNARLDCHVDQLADEAPFRIVRDRSY